VGSDAASMQQPVKATDYVGQAIRRYWRIGVPNVPGVPGVPGVIQSPVQFERRSRP
jgi:hypothetical protein